MQRAGFVFDEAIGGQTWVARALDQREFPPLEKPWPDWLQSGIPSDLAVYLPINAGFMGGYLAASEQWVAAQTAVDNAMHPPVGVSLDVRRSISPCAHASYRVDVPAGLVRQVYAASRNRGYSLIVNTGPNAVTIAYASDASALTFPLAPGGVGFHELVNGTTGSLTVFGSGGASFVDVVDGTYDPVIYP